MCFHKPKVGDNDRRDNRDHQDRVQRPSKSSKDKLSIRHTNKRAVTIKVKSEQELNDTFAKQRLTCAHCMNTYSIRENKIRLYCDGCEKYYCCAIAGECQGRKCQILVGDEICKSRYCMGCVKRIILLGESCICKKCMR